MSKNENELDTTVDEWRDLLRSDAPDDPGMSIPEICEKFGTKVTATRLKIQRLVRAGKCRKGYAIRISESGASYRVTVYDIIKSKERKQ